jgi:hypothetical protein
MKKSNKSYLIFFCITVLSFSCTKKLDLQPMSSISAASFWETNDDAAAGVNAMYTAMRDQAVLNTFILGEARSEVMVRGQAGSVGYDLYYNNLLTSTNAGPSWMGYYAIVNAANLVLKYIPGISSLPATTMNQILAEAYTMRAYAYFIMVRTWGELVIRTEPLESYDPATVNKERLSKEEVFKFIKEDLEKALQLFPDNNFTTGRAKWSKPAVNALKADVYLWTAKQLNGGTNDFNAVLTAISEIEKANVALLPNFADVFSYTNKGNKEVIMAVRQLVNESSSGYTNYMYGGFPIPSCTPDNIKTLIGTQGAGINHAWQISNAVRSVFTNDDLRKDATYVDLFTYNASCTPTAYYATLTMKYKGTVVNGVRNFADDIIVYRYADVLLMKAEAENALGLDPSAAINTVRKRAYGAQFASHTFVRGTKQENDVAILKERLLELVIEGKRWWDLVRFGKAFDMIPTLKSRGTDEGLLLFPISNNTLSLEPLLNQNPGY